MVLDYAQTQNKTVDVGSLNPNLQQKLRKKIEEHF